MRPPFQKPNAGPSGGLEWLPSVVGSHSAPFHPELFVSRRHPPIWSFYSAVVDQLVVAAVEVSTLQTRFEAPCGLRRLKLKALQRVRGRRRARVFARWCIVDLVGGG